MKFSSILRTKRWLIEAILLLFILAIVAMFRFWNIDSIPAGLHYDEAIDLRQGLRILDGDLFLFTGEGWGREGLYYYLVATSLAFISDNFVALRATVALTSIGVAITSYFLARRFSERQTAWFTVAWYAVLFWSVFAGRFAVRGITLSLLLGLTALSFWMVWEAHDKQPSRRLLLWVIPGVFLGLTMYTYQPARFIPGLFLLFSGYIWLINRDEFRSKWKGLLVLAATSLFVALPLMFVLLSNPQLESGREWTIAPLLELLDGKPSLLLGNIWSTAKMFTFSGDPLIADNIPFRPLFIPRWTSIFFYAGLVIALVRWRKPYFMFVLLWLLISIVPTVVTTSAPNHNRLIGALFPITFLAALPVKVASDYVRQKWDKRAAHLVSILAVVAVAITAAYTWQDYFNNWSQVREQDFRVQFNVAIEEMADQLESQAKPEAILINSRNLEDSHPYILEVTYEGNEPSLRWVDTAQAMVKPVGEVQASLYLESGRWISERLVGFLGLDGNPIEDHQHFAVFEIDYTKWPGSTSEAVRVIPSGQSPVSNESLPEAVLPIRFGETVQLSGLYQKPAELVPGTTLTFFSRWDIVQDGRPEPLAFFVHLVDEENELIAQQDGLGFPPHSWRSGDSFVHEHSIAIPETLSSGKYYLQLGLYDRSTGIRWQIATDSEMSSDRLLVSEIMVD